MKKYSKDELTEILQRILRQDNYNDMVAEVNDIADEHGLDITEIEEDEEEVVIEDDIDWEAEDSDADDDSDWNF